jgi:hypothetical protein
MKSREEKIKDEEIEGWIVKHKINASELGELSEAEA